jgi:Alkaline phosphatase PhoX
MKNRVLTVSVVLALAIGMAGIAAASLDFGKYRDKTLANLSKDQFGFGGPLANSSSQQVTRQEAQADPTSLFTLAKGLTARVVSTEAAPVIDQSAFWPNAKHPEYLIACNEQGPGAPAVQRINIATGAATTIVSGTRFCDPVRQTPWGTYVFAEESGHNANGGRVYELIDPIDTTGVSLDRTTGEFSGGTGAGNLRTLTALGRNGWEGFGILPNGVTIASGDDTGVGPKDGGPGDSYFKFIPDHLWTPGDPPIGDLSQSPFTSGAWYGLRVADGDSWGQGREFGDAEWIALKGGDDPRVATQGLNVGLTGYYRPEDMDIDGAALASGLVRVCSPDTGDEETHFFGQTVCISDGSISQSASNSGPTQIEPFVFGGTSKGINMPDNIAYQPGRGNWILHEDAETTFEFPHNNDLWDCLPDGQDQDLLSDGCVRVGTLNDLTAEWTGGIFDASGTRFFVSIQHNISRRSAVIEIDGWK